MVHPGPDPEKGLLRSGSAKGLRGFKSGPAQILRKLWADVGQFLKLQSSSSRERGEEWGTGNHCTMARLEKQPESGC